MEEGIGVKTRVLGITKPRVSSCSHMMWLASLETCRNIRRFSQVTRGMRRVLFNWVLGVKWVIFESIENFPQIPSGCRNYWPSVKTRAFASLVSSSVPNWAFLILPSNLLAAPFLFTNKRFWRFPWHLGDSGCCYFVRTFTLLGWFLGRVVVWKGIKLRPR